MELKRMTSEEIEPGAIVVEIGPSSRPGGGLQTSIQLGRVIEGSMVRSNPIEALTTGILVEFNILQPEQYRRAEQEVYTTFFASKPSPVDWPEPGVYAWPETLLPLTFNEHRPAGWRKHVQIRLKNIAPVVTLEE